MKRIILWVLIALTLIFIWGNSCLTKEQSTVLSDFVARIFGINPDGPDALEGVHYLRKIAHLTEFAALGAELFLLFSRRGLRKSPLPAVLFGGGVALVDETIQLFSDRGSQVLDVWIDLAGCAIGVAVTALILLMIRKVRGERQ